VNVARAFKTNSSSATIAVSDLRPKFQTLLGLGTGLKSTGYRRIRGATDLADHARHNVQDLAEATRQA
jgi:hypothetical protein